MNHFSGQVAIVTGGANGIGGATAELLKELGAHVVVFDREKPDCTANIENIVIKQAKHLRLLKRAHSSMRTGHEDPDSFFSSHGVFGRTACVPRGGT